MSCSILPTAFTSHSLVAREPFHVEVLIASFSLHHYSRPSQGLPQQDLNHMQGRMQALIFVPSHFIMFKHW